MRVCVRITRRAGPCLLTPLPLSLPACLPVSGVLLAAAHQAGILQGQVDGLMVMDQWQASLMRALAQLQLQASPDVRKRVQEKFDLQPDGDAGAAGEEGGPDAREGQEQQQKPQRKQGSRKKGRQRRPPAAA